MNSVLLRLDGPLQSWGDHSAFTHRDTCDYPTKSGVIGLVSAALGRDRHHDPADLAACDFAVRLDQPGTVMTDYHTAGTAGWVNTEGKVTVGEPKISTREYLQDAVFTAALATADQALADTVAAALACPVWPLYLGRRSCPPAAPILIGVHPGGPVDALTTLAYQGHRSPPPSTMTIVHEAAGGAETVYDQPIGYGVLTRSYLPRTLARTVIATPGTVGDDQCAPGDSFTEARW